MRRVFFPMAQQPLVGQGLLIIEASWSHAVRHTPYSVGLSRRLISPTERLLLNNIQHSQQTYTHAPADFEPKIQACERQQTYALDRAATGNGETRQEPYKATKWRWDLASSINITRFLKEDNGKCNIIEWWRNFTNKTRLWEKLSEI